VDSKSQRRSWQANSRIALAVAASVFLHASVLGVAASLPSFDALAPIELTQLSARLLPRVPEAPIPDDGLIKNTLPPQETQAPAPRASKRDEPKAAKAARRPVERQRPTVDDARQRIAEMVLYPPEALEQGLEGEVIVLLEIDAAGHVQSAAIASGSGHAILDAAALRAVREVGTLSPAMAGRTILLPVRFQLR
jgi:protein TonB